MRGFTDAAIESQSVFRAVMEAMARPTSVQPLTIAVEAPAPLSAELAAVALTLADTDTRLWLDEALRASPEVTHYLRFHTGATLTDDAASADFALVSAPELYPPLAAFPQGTAHYPDQSATLVLEAGGFAAADGAQFTGPGIASDAAGRCAAERLPADFISQIAANRAQYPLGVDLIFVARGAVSALPRSSAPHMAPASATASAAPAAHA